MVTGGKDSSSEGPSLQRKSVINLADKNKTEMTKKPSLSIFSLATKHTKKAVTKKNDKVELESSPESIHKLTLEPPR
jgi:hypothetical protein